MKNLCLSVRNGGRPRVPQLHSGLPESLNANRTRATSRSPMFFAAIDVERLADAGGQFANPEFGTRWDRLGQVRTLSKIPG